MKPYDQDFAAHLSTPESALAFAKQLLAEKAHAERRYYEFLLELEARPALWNLYAPTFASYLHGQHLGLSTGFEEYKKGREHVAPNVIDQIGVSAVRAASRVRNIEARKGCVARMQETARKEGVPLSKFNADRIAKDFDPEVNTSKKEVGTLNYAQLQRENERLRRKVERLEAINATLKARLAKVRERRGDAHPPAN